MLIFEQQAHLTIELTKHQDKCPKNGGGVIRQGSTVELDGFPGFKVLICGCGLTHMVGCQDCDRLVSISTDSDDWCEHAELAFDAGLMSRDKGQLDQ